MCGAKANKTGRQKSPRTQISAHHPDSPRHVDAQVKGSQIIRRLLSVFTQNIQLFNIIMLTSMITDHYN